jgi:hypothetical protein
MELVSWQRSLAVIVGKGFWYLDEKKIRSHIAQPPFEAIIWMKFFSLKSYRQHAIIVEQYDFVFFFHQVTENIWSVSEVHGVGLLTEKLSCNHCSTPFRSNNLDEILFTEELQTACYNCYCDTVIRTIYGYLAEKSPRLAANGDMSGLWRQPCNTACPYDRYCSTPFRSNNLDEILFTEELQTACYNCYCDTVISYFFFIKLLRIYDQFLKFMELVSWQRSLAVIVGKGSQ